MTVATTIDVHDMPNAEYRAVMDRMGVEARPEPGIYLHITAQTDFGYRVIEIWDSQQGFEEFAQRRMLPALPELASTARPRSPSSRCTTSSLPASRSCLG
jgi:hypothetical protein